MFRSFKSLFLQVITIFAAAAFVQGATLTVYVRNSSNELVANSYIAVQAFNPSLGFEPVADKSDVKLAASGVGTFSVESGYDYQVFVTKQGMGPSIKDQMFNPNNYPVSTSGGDLSVTRYLNTDAYYSASAGYILLKISSFGEEKLLFSDVRNLTTDEPVAFGMVKLSSYTQTALSILNVPAAAAGSYGVFVGIPGDNRGYNFTLSSAVVANSYVEFTISSNTFGTASSIDTGGVDISGDIAFEGVVVDESGAGIPNCAITLYRENTEEPSDWKWDNSIRTDETRTDYSGYFSFYDVYETSYAVQVTKEGYEGRWITSTFDGNQNEDGLWPGKNILVQDWYRNGKITLPDAPGKITGYVKFDNGDPVMRAHIQAWPDWDQWTPVAENVATTQNDGGGYDNYFTTGNERAGRTDSQAEPRADGYFEIEGLGVGNYNIAIWSDLVESSNYDGIHYNYGNDGNRDDTNGYRSGDDLRVHVSSDLWTATVYAVDGTTVALNGEPITILIGSAPQTAGTITGTITFDTDQPTVNIPVDQPIMIGAHSDGGGRDYVVSKYGTLEKSFNYTLNVATGSQYWVEIKSKNWGALGRMDMRADLQSQDSISGFDFRLAPAGWVRGIIKRPDGKIFERNWNEYVDGTTRYHVGTRMDLEADGVNVQSYGWGNVEDDSYFTIGGLIPGTYEIMTRGEKEIEIVYNCFTTQEPRVRTTEPLDWPNVTLKDIKVKEGEETYVEIQLKNGARVIPQTPALPAITMPGGNYFMNSTLYIIFKIPSSIGAKREVFANLLGGDGDPMSRFDFMYKDGEWQKRRILSGRYDFLLARYTMYNAGFDDRTPESEYMNLTFISGIKNKEINYDPLKPDATTYLEFESGTLGQSILYGTVAGENTFTEKDVTLINASGMEKFLAYIPSIMLYDADGQLKGFSMGLPKKERVFQWDARINNGTFTYDWFENELENYPLRYKIERLPAGKYIAVFETPNYPPMMKKVELTSGSNELNISFDDNVVIGSSIEGVVKSTDGAVLGDALIKVKHKAVEKSITTAANGTFNVPGLPPGVYRMTINKPGFAPSAEKFALGRDVKYFTGNDALILTRADAAISGKISELKQGMYKAVPNVKVVAYSESYNVNNPNKMLPVISIRSNAQGAYYLDGIVSTQRYKVFVLAQGKLLEWKLFGGSADSAADYKNILSPGPNANNNFVLKSLPPQLKLTMNKIYENGRFLYKFYIESPKQIINPSNPNALAAPYCRYSPIASASGAFDSNTAVEVLPTIGSKIILSDGSEVYTYSLKVPVADDHEFYKLKVEATDGSNDFSEELVFGPKIEARSQKDLKEEMIEGGDVSIDDTGTDLTQITVDAGSLTASNEQSSSVSQDNVEIPIGGFLSALPNFNLSKTGSSRSAAMAKLVDSIVASDVYEVALEDAQMNKDISINLKYDIDRITEEDLDNLMVGQFNSSTGEWEMIPGVVTVDPISSVVAVDVGSVSEAAGTSSQSSRRAGRSIVKNGMFALNAAAATSQNGLFAVFTQDPASVKAYTGADFQILNFPNPFNLKSKSITLQDVYSNQSQTVTGTAIKYALPTDKGGRIKFNIYNLAAEMVKEIDEGEKDGGYYYYTEWDGTNDSGENCASGIYFLIPKVNNDKLITKPYKMAILK